MPCSRISAASSNDLTVPDVETKHVEIAVQEFGAPQSIARSGLSDLEKAA
jgi:hypothetical protein